MLDITLDVGFKNFYNFCKANDIPVVIISRFVCPPFASSSDAYVGSFAPRSGMAPLIRAVLSKLIGDEEAKNIEIIANDAIVREDGTWEIQYRHPSR